MTLTATLTAGASGTVIPRLPSPRTPGRGTLPKIGGRWALSCMADQSPPAPDPHLCRRSRLERDPLAVMNRRGRCVISEAAKGRWGLAKALLKDRRA